MSNIISHHFTSIYHTFHIHLPPILSSPCLAPGGVEFQLPSLALSGRRWLQVGGQGAATRWSLGPGFMVAFMLGFGGFIYA